MTFRVSVSSHHDSNIQIWQAFSLLHTICGMYVFSRQFGLGLMIAVCLVAAGRFMTILLPSIHASLPRPLVQCD